MYQFLIPFTVRGSAFNGIWPGDAEVEPGYYSCLELDFPKCKHSKKNSDSSLCVFHNTPKVGPGRMCGMSGTADTHEYHLEQIVKKCLGERDCPPISDKIDPDQPLASKTRKPVIIDMTLYGFLAIFGNMRDMVMIYFKTG